MVGYDGRDRAIGLEKRNPVVTDNRRWPCAGAPATGIALIRSDCAALTANDALGYARDR